MSDDTPITDDERARVEARHAGDGAVSDPLAEMIQARLGAEWRCAPALAAAVRAYARARVPDEEELARLASGCDPDVWPKTVNPNDAWTESFRRRARVIRAVMLARLAGQ